MVDIAILWCSGMDIESKNVLRMRIFLFIYFFLADADGDGGLFDAMSENYAARSRIEKLITTTAFVKPTTFLPTSRSRT